MPFVQIKPTSATSEGPLYQTLERSSTGEYSAIRQPDGYIIAFHSKRSGEQQIWLSKDNHSMQLTDFPLDTYLMGMRWARDGESLLVNANHQFYQVYLDGQIKHHPTQRSVGQLFHWDSDMNLALSIIRIDGVATLTEIELDTGNYTVITDKAVTWAQKVNNDFIIYSDHMNRFWRPGPVGDELIEMLNGYGSDKRFVVNNGVIYGVRDDMRLWSFKLEGNVLEILGDLPQRLDHITDVDDTALFGVVRVSAKKELVELLLK